MQIMSAAAWASGNRVLASIIFKKSSSEVVLYKPGNIQHHTALSCAGDSTVVVCITDRANSTNI